MQKKAIANTNVTAKSLQHMNRICKKNLKHREREKKITMAKKTMKL